MTRDRTAPLFHTCPTFSDNNSVMQMLRIHRDVVAKMKNRV